MFVKNIVSGLFLVLCCFSSYTFAGTEDWEGQYTITMSNQNVDVVHTPKQVRFLFLSAGKCLSMSKGSKINGIEIPVDVKFCTDDNIPNFTAMVQKLGIIKSKSIKPGPSYHD